MARVQDQDPNRPRAPRGPVWGAWHGGPSYGIPGEGDYEQFKSRSHARQVFQSRSQGWDPIGRKETPNVSDSEMHLYLSDPSEASDPYPDYSFKQTNRGIRTERY